MFRKCATMFQNTYWIFQQGRAHYQLTQISNYIEENEQNVKYCNVKESLLNRHQLPSFQPFNDITLSMKQTKPVQITVLGRRKTLTRLKKKTVLLYSQNKQRSVNKIIPICLSIKALWSKELGKNKSTCSFVSSGLECVISQHAPPAIKILN